MHTLTEATTTLAPARLRMLMGMTASISSLLLAMGTRTFFWSLHAGVQACCHAVRFGVGVQVYVRLQVLSAGCRQGWGCC